MENLKKMEIDQKMEPSVSCRLCGKYGDHRFEIFDSSAEDSSSSLSKKILRCLDIEVISSDPTTVICAECFNKLFGYDQFREVCYATNRKIKIARLRHHNGVGNGVIFKSNVKREADERRNGEAYELSILENSEPKIERMEDDSESNGEADELAIPEILTPKIERTEVVPYSQVNDLAESSANGIPVFASTPSTVVKHEYTANSPFSPKLELIGNEETVDILMDAIENESLENANSIGDDNENISDNDARSVGSPFSVNKIDSKTATETDADGVNHIVRVPRKKTLRKMRASMPTVTIKKEYNVIEKRKKNASKFLIKCLFNDRCRDLFVSPEAMKLHVKTYHENRAERTFCCHLCNTAVTERKYLKRHMNSLHTGVFRFMCPNRDCSKIFSKKGNLNRHINAMHNNQGTFKCPKCSEAFARKHLLKKHLAVVHGDGIAFVCDLCKKSFTTKGNLKTHFKFTHTEVILYECPEATCTKSFKEKSYMKKHFNIIHSQQKAFKCTKCPAEFAWNKSLRLHSLQKH